MICNSCAISLMSVAAAPPEEEMQLLAKSKELTTDLDEEIEKPKQKKRNRSIADLIKPMNARFKPIKGGYSIQVHIIEGRELKGRGIGDMSDPVVKVECFGMRKTTGIKHATLNPRWDECLYFEIADLDPKQLEMERISITVFDANTFRKNVVIGSYEFDASFVYYSDHHEIFRQWIGLSDITDAHEGVQGYLKVTIVCLGPGDEQKIHSFEEIDEFEQKSSDDVVLMPPHIDQKGYILTLNFHCAQHLPNMDLGILGGSCDPYVVASFGGITVKTSVFEKQLNPIFNQALQLAVMEPIMSDRIIISIYDKDKLDKDDLICIFTISYRNAKKGYFKNPVWFSLYGAAENVRNENALQMAKGYIEGSHYRGRILLSASVDRVEEPKSSERPLSIGGVHYQNTLSKYVLQCDLYNLIESPVANKSKIKIVLRCADYVWESSEKVVTEGSAEFYEAMSEENGSINLSMDLPSDFNQVSDIFVYLIHKKEEICYSRISFKDLISLGFDSSPKWLEFKHDRSTRALEKGTFPGMILLGLRCGFLKDLPSRISSVSRPSLDSTFSPNIEQKNMPLEENKLEDEIDSKTQPKSEELGQLDIEIVQAKDILAVDKMSSSSDPYVKVTIGSKSVKTKHILKNLNPIWKESFSFSNLSWNAKILIEVFDWNSVLSHVKLGELELSLSELSKYSTRCVFSESKWFTVDMSGHKSSLYIKFNHSLQSSKASQNLSVKVTSPTRHKKIISTSASKFKYFSKPTQKTWKLRVNLYLSNGLEAADSDGLADPFVVLRCNGAAAESSKKRRTLAPEWFETISLDVALPEDPVFCPDVFGFIYDFDYLDSNEVMGRFRIPASQILQLVQGVTSAPNWYELFDYEGKVVSGRILLSFELLNPLSQTQLVSIKPAYDPMWAEIYMLGLRDLKGTFIKKPHVEFAIQGEKPLKTKASCVPSVVNPNILQVLKIPINMPKEISFAPTINVQVVDNWFGSAFKQAIGNGSIPLGVSYSKFEETIEYKQENLQAFKNVTQIESMPNYKIEDDHQTPLVHPVEAGTSYAQPSSGSYIQIDIPEANSKAVEATSLLSDFDSTEENISEMVHFVKWGEKVKGQSSQSILPFLKDRTIYDNELEDEFNVKPFEEFILKHGKKRKNAKNADNLEVGKLKALVRITNDSASVQKDSGIFKDILTPAEVFVRLYVLKGESLTPQDLNGSSDPYLFVSLGEKTISLRDRYISNSLNPEFYEVIEFPCTIPGASLLNVSVYDYDGIADDLIGSTIIDIEDRWFSRNWRNLKKKPVEWRTLHSPTSKVSQGKLQLWVDILTASDAKRNPIEHIKPPSPLEFELRVIIWKTDEITIKDEITEQNDLYVTGSLDIPGYEDRQKTDVHLRSKLGKGSFNWRMVFPVHVPLASPRFKLQVWDMDVFSSNDSICEASISLSSLFNKAFETKEHVKLLSESGEEKIWINDLRHPNFGSKSQGKIQISIELLPKSKAERYPAGLGRDEPNLHPTLPPPEGRLQFNILKPWAFLKDLLGDKIYTKICLLLFCGLFITSAVFFAPTFFASIVAEIITG